MLEAVEQINSDKLPHVIKCETSTAESRARHGCVQYGGPNSDLTAQSVRSSRRAFLSLTHRITSVQSQTATESESAFSES